LALARAEEAVERERRMSLEQRGDLAAGVPGRAEDGGLHPCRFLSFRSWRARTILRASAPFLVTMITVSSPARVPSTSRQPARSSATARAFAPPGGVLSTTRFWAGVALVSQPWTALQRARAASFAAGEASGGSS